MFLHVSALLVTALEIDLNGQASVTQNLLTSLNTELVYSLPLRAGSYEFVGFSFLPGRACDPPPDWIDWERAENSLEITAASPLRTQGGAWCVQAEYRLAEYEIRSHYFLGGQGLATRVGKILRLSPVT